ncbi:MAG: hypothetical protein EOP82_18030 [Variovorax sp.]|nr:MAG: hypothetical protein EOP82_18030 [Variovorax sp.]
MTTWMRMVLWVAWLVTVSWFWHGGVLGTASALAASALSLVLFVWPPATHRRRRTALRYVEMGKQPVGLP